MAGSAQTPQNSYGRGEAKMPPVGNFSVPASAGKENKKRPRNNASGVSGQGNSMIDSSARGMAQNAKVSFLCLSRAYLFSLPRGLGAHIRMILSIKHA
jgi:hypothetical protein